MNELGLIATDYEALMALTGLVCGCLVSLYIAIVLKVVL